MSDELKPVRCGCGGEAKIDKHTYYRALPTYGVRCHRCGQETRQFYMTEAEAVTAWNKAMSTKDINVPTKFATDTNVGDKEMVIIEPLVITYGGYCKCGNLVNTDCQYCPKCGAKLVWK